MIIKRLNPRNIIISYPDLDQTNILVIYAEKYTYICDTFLGPMSMEPIKSMLAEDNRTQPIVVFNSHHDWDHVWGNCAFNNSIIVGHFKCRELLEKNFTDDFEKFGHNSKGTVKPYFPNLLFNDKLLFSDDEVEFFYTPGHTEDSASCYDKKTKTLYVGDNIEFPLPYIQSKDLKGYISSLKKYNELEVEVIVTGHGEQGSKELLASNLNYIESLYNNNGVLDESKWSEDIKKRHKLNLTKLL